jgi:hypothetical protein
MYEHRFKTLVSNGDHIYDERGNRLWNGMLFSSKKALLLNLSRPILSDNTKPRYNFARAVTGVSSIYEFWVARFFLEQLTKTGKKIPKWPQKYQMAIKYTKWP